MSLEELDVILEEAITRKRELLNACKFRIGVLFSRFQGVDQDKKIGLSMESISAPSKTRLGS